MSFFSVFVVCPSVLSLNDLKKRQLKNIFIQEKFASRLFFHPGLVSNNLILKVQFPFS